MLCIEWDGYLQVDTEQLDPMPHRDRRQSLRTEHPLVSGAAGYLGIYSALASESGPPRTAQDARNGDTLVDTAVPPGSETQ